MSSGEAHTFPVAHLVTPGATYMFEIISQVPAADTDRAAEPTSNGGACIPGLVFDAVAVTASTTITIGQLQLAGTSASDFLPVNEQCSSQTLTAGASCTVGVRFARQATGPGIARGHALAPLRIG